MEAGSIVAGPTSFRHYANLRRCEDRWSALLDDFEWTTCAELLCEERRAAA